MIFSSSSHAKRRIVVLTADDKLKVCEMVRDKCPGQK